MRPVSRLKWGFAFVVLGLAAFLNVISPPGVQANVITNGDFSTGTFEGWNVSGDGGVSIQNMSSLPAAITAKWDLSSWNTVMEGNFLMLSGQNDLKLSTVIIPFSTPSVPISFSFDYALAWNVRNIVSTPSQAVDAYIPIDIFGENPHTYELQHYEITWSDLDTRGPVRTGSVKLTNFADRLPSYNGISVGLYTIRLGTFDAIVGLDNFQIEVMPIDSDGNPVSGPAPVPEPATCVLLMASLAGTAWYTRKRSSRG